MTTNLKIEDMTCENCVKHVRRALEKVPGVQAAEVQLEPGWAVVSGDGFENEALVHAVERAGYRVVEISA